MPTAIETAAMAVSFLRGRPTAANREALLAILRRAEPIAEDVKAALCAGLLPTVPGRNYINGACIIELRSCRGRPTNAAARVVKEHDFLAAFEINDALSPPVSSRFIEHSNRSRFARFVRTRIDVEPRLRSAIAEAFEGRSTFALKISPRAKRRVGRPRVRETVAKLGALMARSAIDAQMGDLGPLFPYEQLEREASRRALAPETLRRKMQRFAARK